MHQSHQELLEAVQTAPEPDGTSRRIIDAAREAFLDSGIRRTSMNEIARRAGLGVATVYRRFPQKNELVSAVLLREASRFVDEVDRKIQTAATAEQEIVDCYLAFVVGVRQNALLNRLLATDRETLLPALTVNAGPVLTLGRRYLADNIRRMQREGKIPDYDPEPVAEIIGRLAHSLLLSADGIIPSQDDLATREFARRYVTPLITRRYPAE